MPRQSPQVPRSPPAVRGRRRWPLLAACLTLLVGASAVWLTSQRLPLSRPARPAERAGAQTEQAAQRPRGEWASPAERRRRRPAEAEPAVPDESQAAALPAAEPAPPDEPESDERGAATPSAATGAPLAPEPGGAAQEAAEEHRQRAQPRRRQLELALLRRWTQPGLCARPEQATQAQRTLMSHFRASELATGARVFLDPRLPAGAEQPALGYLEEAQRILQAELQLTPGVPDVFLYQDVQLLLASACTNADVVAYYDGALHVVVTRDDVRESVLHELTHHALISSGVLGPAWIQEGMAMHIAGESWWQRPDLLQRLIERPFGLSSMETAIPYTLENEQAVLFYAQAAAMVECALRESDSTLRGLLTELDVQQASETLDYALPGASELSALRECLRELLQEPQQQ